MRVEKVLQRDHCSLIGRFKTTAFSHRKVYRPAAAGGRRNGYGDMQPVVASYGSCPHGRAFNLATKKSVIKKSMNLAPILV
jgi:hypothetical protein